jgi:hypothetical protein
MEEQWYKVWTCPIKEEECPYCNSNGDCTLDDPLNECEDAMDWYATITFGGGGD